MLSRVAADIELEKRRIRDAVRARRAALGPAERHRARDGLTDQLVALVRRRGARSVSCYLPVGHEPDPTAFLDWAGSHDVEVLLPVSRADRLLDWARLGPEGLAPGAHGIPEPVGPRLPPEAAGGVDLMLIPACAVDGAGNRLGWGLGYFDRCLARLDPPPPVFAVVHAGDVVERVPAEPHDVPVTGVVTPDGAREFAARRAGRGQGNI